MGRKSKKINWDDGGSNASSSGGWDNSSVNNGGWDNSSADSGNWGSAQAGSASSGDTSVSGGSWDNSAIDEAARAKAANAWASGVTDSTTVKHKITADKGAFVTALVCGLIGTAAALAVYMLLPLPAILTVGLAVLLAAGLPLVGLCAWNVSHPSRHRMGPEGLAVCAAALALLFGAGCLMQFLYDLGSETKAIEFDDYVFIIDDSASMQDNDPQNKRVSSLETMLAQVGADKQIGMVCFEGDITQSLPPMPATPEQVAKLTDTSGLLTSGGHYTYIYGALDHALNLPAVNDSSRMSMLVLLTDGVGGDMMTDEISRRCADQNVVITCIALGDNADESGLSQLAKKTGGAFFNVDSDDTQDFLSQAYQQVNYLSTHRELLGVRPGPVHDSLGLALLRIASWLLFGLLAGAAAMLMLSRTLHPLLLPIVSAVCGLVVGLLLELFNMLWLEWPIWRAVLVLYGLFPLFWKKEYTVVNHDADGFGNHAGDIGYDKDDFAKQENGPKGIDRL